MGHDICCSAVQPPTARSTQMLVGHWIRKDSCILAAHSGALALQAEACGHDQGCDPAAHTRARSAVSGARSSPQGAHTLQSMAERLAVHTDVSVCLVVGGLSFKSQEATLAKSPDMIVATPARLIDLLCNGRSFGLDTVRVCGI